MTNERSQCWGDPNLLHNLDEVHARLVANGMTREQASMRIELCAELSGVQDYQHLPSSESESVRLNRGLRILAGDNEFKPYRSRGPVNE